MAPARDIGSQSTVRRVSCFRKGFTHRRHIVEADAVADRMASAAVYARKMPRLSSAADLGGRPQGWPNDGTLGHERGLLRPSRTISPARRAAFPACLVRRRGMSREPGHWPSAKPRTCDRNSSNDNRKTAYSDLVAPAIFGVTQLHEIRAGRNQSGSHLGRALKLSVRTRHELGRSIAGIDFHQARQTFAIAAIIGRTRPTGRAPGWYLTAGLRTIRQPRSALGRDASAKYPMRPSGLTPLPPANPSEYNCSG